MLRAQPSGLAGKVLQTFYVKDMDGPVLQSNQTRVFELVEGAADHLTRESAQARDLLVGNPQVV